MTLKLRAAQDTFFRTLQIAQPDHLPSFCADAAPNVHHSEETRSTSNAPHNSLVPSIVFPLWYQKAEAQTYSSPSP